MSTPNYGWRPEYAGYAPESTTSALSTTSYGSRSENRDASRDRSYRDRDATRDATRDSEHSQQRDAGFGSKKDMTSSSDTGKHGSYNPRWADYQKTEWGCNETGGWQKLSFLLLIMAFLGHSIAVCTPYWAVGWEGDQWTVYEGVWLSCYRERGLGRWICSTYDTIRNLFEQPVWYEASQVTAVLSVILLLPALVVATLYTYVVGLSGRSRASWVLVIFLGGSALCGFLSFIIFGAGYPLDQEFPPGDVRFHISFALQIISFLFCVASLATHLKDSYRDLRQWNSESSGSRSHPRSGGLTAIGGGRPIELARFPPDSSSSAPPPKSRAPTLGNFSLPKFPSALSRFRSKGNDQNNRDSVDRREPTATIDHTTSGTPSQHQPSGYGNASTYRSYAPPSSGGGSVSGYDSVV